LESACSGDSASLYIIKIRTPTAEALAKSMEIASTSTVLNCFPGSVFRAVSYDLLQCNERHIILLSEKGLSQRSFTDQYLSNSRNQSSLSYPCTEIFCHQDTYFEITGYTLGTHCICSLHSQKTRKPSQKSLEIFMEMYIFSKVAVLI
jgi:hypothetical protein